MVFKFILVIDGWDISYEISSRWMSLDLTESTLVQVMAQCRQATSHYLRQCRSISLSPYGVTRPQWLNSLASGTCGSDFKSIIFKLITQNSSLGTHWDKMTFADSIFSVTHSFQNQISFKPVKFRIMERYQTGNEDKVAWHNKCHFVVKIFWTFVKL